MPSKYLEAEFQIGTDEATATVSAWGATLTAFVVGEKSVIKHASRAEVEESFAGVTLAPWPNRLDGGVWNYQGVELKAPVNDGQGNANHGLVFNREFEVVDKNSEQVIFEYEFGLDEVYPFKVRFRVGYEIVGAQLITTISGKNEGYVDAPFSFGSHPYLQVSPDSRVLISCETQSVNSVSQIPIGSEPAFRQKGSGDFSDEGAKFGDLKLDDCFMELDRDSSGIAETKITHSDGTVVSLWQDENFKYLMVYTHPSAGLAVEPMTSPANALNSETDLCWLKPGESITAKWGIRVDFGKLETK